MQESVREIKKVGDRYYYFSQEHFRSMPIKKSLAKELLSTGEAIMVDRFVTDKVIESPVNVEEKILETSSFAKPTVVDFVTKQRQRFEAERLEADKQEFINVILPRLTGDELKTIVSVMNDPEAFRTELLRIMMRIKVSEI